MAKKKPPNLARRTYDTYRHQADRARAAGLTLNYTLDELRALVRTAIERTEKCRYCSRRLTVKNFSVDHARPLSRGGTHTFLNLVVCCRRCNEVKGALNVWEYESLRRLLDQWEGSDGAHDLLRRLRAGGSIRRAHA